MLLRQELSNDPLGILRPPTKLRHHLPLSSAYAAVAESRDLDPSAQRLRQRLDPVHREPKVPFLSPPSADCCCAAWHRCACFSCGSTRSQPRHVPRRSLSRCYRLQLSLSLTPSAFKSQGKLCWACACGLAQSVTAEGFAVSFH